MRQRAAARWPRNFPSARFPGSLWKPKCYCGPRLHSGDSARGGRKGSTWPASSARCDAVYCFTAMAEISIFAPPIKPATCTVARAGFGSGMSFL